MKAHTTLTTTPPPATVRTILGTANPRPPTGEPRGAAAPGAARSAPQSGLDDSALFREEIYQRSTAPYTLAWRHGGLNE